MKLTKKYIPILVITGIVLSIVIIYIINKINICSLDASDFFPRANVSLVYSGGYENAGYTLDTRYINNKLITLETDTGNTSFKAYSLNKKNAVRIYSKTGNYESYNGEVNENHMVLMKPFKTGVSWKGDDGSQNEITGVGVIVFTMCGIYNTIEVTTSPSEYDYKIKNYYAQNVGIVKSVFETPDGRKNVSRLKRVSSTSSTE